MAKKHTIWTNHNLNFDDWKSDLKELYPDKSEDELINIMYDTNNEYLYDERKNLDIQLPRSIIVIADIERWNGRFPAFKEITSGNIKDCLYSECDYSTWYVDRLGDLRCDAIHHDGTNHYLYRVVKESISDLQIETLKNRIYSNIATRLDITKATDRIGDRIAKVYGFDLSKLSANRSLER